MKPLSCDKKVLHESSVQPKPTHGAERVSDLGLGHRYLQQAMSSAKIAELIKMSGD